MQLKLVLLTTLFALMLVETVICAGKGRGGGGRVSIWVTRKASSRRSSSRRGSGQNKKTSFQPLPEEPDLPDIPVAPNKQSSLGSSFGSASENFPRPPAPRRPTNEGPKEPPKRGVRTRPKHYPSHAPSAYYGRNSMQENPPHYQSHPGSQDEPPHKLSIINPPKEKRRHSSRKRRTGDGLAKAAVTAYVMYKFSEWSSDMSMENHEDLYDTFATSWGIPRPSGYSIHHYYHGRKKIPKRIMVDNSELVYCEGESTICLNGTTSICLYNGTMMCLSEGKDLWPCKIKRSMNCVRTVVSCDDDSISCANSTEVNNGTNSEDNIQNRNSPDGNNSTEDGPRGPDQDNEGGAEETEEEEEERTMAVELPCISTVSFHGSLNETVLQLQKQASDDFATGVGATDSPIRGIDFEMFKEDKIFCLVQIALPEQDNSNSNEEK